MSALHGTFYFLYMVVPICGVALNCYVFMKLLRVARRSGSRFETTSGLPLSAMSISDSVCLLAQFAQFLVHFTSLSTSDDHLTRFADNEDMEAEVMPDVLRTPNRYMTFICKVDLYLMHSTSAFSVWCWLVLSVLRYVAVFHPFKYRTIWRQPRYALKSLAFACLAAESWILYCVVYDKEQRSCTEDVSLSAQHVKTAHLMDIVVFYAIPSFLRLVFDSIVLFRCYSCGSGPSAFEETTFLYDRRLAISAPTERKSSSFDCVSLDSTAALRRGSTQKAQLVLFATLTLQQQQQLNSIRLRTRTRAQQAACSRRRTAMIMRSLLISAVNLACNLPSHLLRTYLTLSDEIGQPEQNEEAGEGFTSTLHIIESVSQVLYFSQFVCNAFYLSTTIYETSSLASTAAPPRRPPSLGRQVSRCTSNECVDI